MSDEPVVAAPQRARRVGHGGGLILEHRAFVTLPYSLRELARGVALVVGFTLGWLLLLGPLGRLYLAAYVRVVPILDPSATVTVARYGVPGPLAIELPYVQAAVGPPDPGHWLVIGFLTAVALLVSFLLPPALLPVAYALRLGAALQAVSLAALARVPDILPYTLSSYSLRQIEASVVLVGLVPVFLGLTYYIFEFSWGRKAVLTALIMGHLAVMVPLQCLLVVGLLRAGSIALLPPLFVFLGLLPEVFVIVAFYGWGMSWRARPEAEA